MTDPATSGVSARAPAPLTNLALAVQTLAKCDEAAGSSTRIGLLYSHPGYGKTIAGCFAATTQGAAYVCARSVWTQKRLLQAIAEELGVVSQARTAPDLLDQIIVSLNADPRALIIDEMDYLVKKQSVDIIRDIHDNAPVSILLIGMEALPAKLKEWEQVDSRVLVATAAQPTSAEDALKLRDHYAGSVAIADDLAVHFAKRCGGVTRRLHTNLQAAEEAGRAAGARAIDRAWWGERPVVTGRVATRRAEMAA